MSAECKIGSKAYELRLQRRIPGKLWNMTLSTKLRDCASYIN